MARDLDDGLLKGSGLLGGGTLFGGKIDAGFIFNLQTRAIVSTILLSLLEGIMRSADFVVSYSNLKVDKLVGHGTHLVVEAKRVIADLIAGKDKVALTLLCALSYNLARRGSHLEIDIERTSRLHL